MTPDDSAEYDPTLDAPGARGTAHPDPPDPHTPHPATPNPPGARGTARPATTHPHPTTDPSPDAPGARGTARPAPTHPHPTTPTQAPTERRLHPITPLRRAWAPIAVLVGWAVHDPDQAQQQLTRLTTTTLLIGLAVLIPAASLYGFLTWWYTHYAVTDTELRIRTGLLFRRTAHIRLERVQAIDVTQPLLARIAGVAKLKLDVIGTGKKDELAFLGAAEARALRAELLARAAGLAPETAHEVGEAPARQLLRVPPGVLAVALLLTGATWGTALAALVVPTLLWLATHNLWTVLATALPLLGAAGANSAGRFVGEYDWAVAESPDGLRIDHGLLDRTHETVPPGRVQTVRIVEPLLWRRRGWVRVELDVAGSSNSVLLPVAPRETAESLVARVLPGVSVPAPASLAGPPRRAGRCRPLWWRGYGLAVTDAVFAARYGLLRRSLALVPHAKVQSVRRTQGPWQRALRLADVHVDTGADKTVTARLRDADEAAHLLDAQAERSRTGRRDAPPDRWMT
ncbi:PH domain-containing protein [Streptomyces sp. NPDC003717]|uniref:PH domain-containing protein n=1 Tax=Streptomyces sp. NPDC003717 TaxID=3154276 RepID=UPI0033A5F773